MTAPLEAVLITEDLKRRPSRDPDYRIENEALDTLAQGLADSPRGILQRLTEIALELCNADSAGISLLSERNGEQIFVWPAVAGAWKDKVGGGMPRHSPCGLVLERGDPQLFAYPERHFRYLTPIDFSIAEALLAPFHIDGKAVGTLWVLVHDDTRAFDGEDLRRLTSLSQFAAAAYRTARLLDEKSKALSERECMEAELRQKATELAELNRRKDEFLAVLAHELRNPMAPISNSLHILRLSSPNEPKTQAVSEMIERQVSQLRRLVDDLTETSRFTRGKITLHKEPVQVHGVVRSAVETSRPLIEAARHELTVTLPEEPLMLEADPVRLTQIITNLLNNAAKYTAAGGRIWLSVGHSGDQLTISVRDTGIGIPADMLTRVFELFMQVDQSAARAQGGLGIGLTLVQHLVAMHGGSVHAVSAGPGRGSEFVVRLPLAAPSVKQENSAAGGEGAASPVRRRILIVDDNRDAADSLGTLFELLGAEARVVYSGPEALDALESCRPHVVLLDIGMPGMDGLEVARRIRQQPAHQSLKLVALTGWGQEEDRRRSQMAGFDFHLVKPVDVAALKSLLTSLERE